MKAEYINHMGDDLTVVNSARVSFDKESDWHHVTENMGDGYLRETGDIELEKSDARLISFLARNGHWTPFSHPQITLRETVPIFVARQRFKHVVGFTYNEVSRRYVSDPPEFYVPDTFRRRAENKKQGSGEDFTSSENIHLTSELKEFYSFCESQYDSLLQQGVCPEQARIVLPQGLYTSYYVTGSLSAFARAYSLRSKPDAQAEIQSLASQWDSVIRPLFPVSWSALVDPYTKVNA